MQTAREQREHATPPSRGSRLTRSFPVTAAALLVVASGIVGETASASSTAGSQPESGFIAVVAGDHVLVSVHGTGRVAVVSQRGRLVDSIAVASGPHGTATVGVDPS